jgi:hypothetical protein
LNIDKQAAQPESPSEARKDDKGGLRAWAKHYIKAPASERRHSAITTPLKDVIKESSDVVAISKKTQKDLEKKLFSYLPSFKQTEDSR